jgi:hypothetical protein
MGENVDHLNDRDADIVRLRAVERDLDGGQNGPSEVGQHAIGVIAGERDPDEAGPAGIEGQTDVLAAHCRASSGALSLGTNRSRSGAS